MIQDNNKIKANAKSLQMAVSRCSMISEAEKLSKKYCIAIELDSRYTADEFSINFLKIIDFCNNIFGSKKLKKIKI